MSTNTRRNAIDRWIFSTAYNVPERAPDPDVELYWRLRGRDLETHWDRGGDEWRAHKQRQMDPHYRPKATTLRRDKPRCA